MVLRLILVLVILVFMILVSLLNFKTPLKKAQYVAKGQQYQVLIKGKDLVAYSATFLGMNYLWGGTTPVIYDTSNKYIGGGFDCSGFVQYTYEHFGINLPRTTMEQINKGASVNIKDLKSGDLVFFTTNIDLPYQVSNSLHS